MGAETTLEHKTIRIDPELLAKLQERADENERTLSQEIRFTLRQALDEKK